MNGYWTTLLKKINFKVLALSAILCGFVSVHDAIADCGGTSNNCQSASSNVYGNCQTGRTDDAGQSAECVKKMFENNASCINIMPVSNVRRISEYTCMRKDRPHKGIDYSVPEGSEVRAAADGMAEPHENPGGFGLYVAIKHERKDGKGSYFYTKYAHLSRIVVGYEKVKQGQLIGYSGNTGRSSGGHLHFEIRTGLGIDDAVINAFCPDIQSLCGNCSKNINPVQCTEQCLKNPDSMHCQGTPGFSFTPDWNAIPRWNPPGIPGTEPPASAQTSGGSRKLGNEECNINTYRDSFSECIFCDLFKILFDTASSIAKASYTSLSGSMVTLVIIGMALWLAVTILKFISAFDVKEPRILIKTIFNQAFVVIVIVTILRMDIQEFLNITITPIFDTGMTLAQLVTSGQSGQTCSGFTPVAENGGIPAAMGNNILCTIQSIQGKILDIMTLGSTSLCIGFFVESWNGIWLFPSVSYVLVGIILWITAFLLMVIYPFLLIDSILQLSIAAALIPVAIAAYAFPLTRKKYVGKVWETFMTAMFTFLFLSIVVFIITTGVESIIGQTLNDKLRSAGTQDKSYEIIMVAETGLAWWGIKFLQLVFMMLLGWAVLDQAKDFAGKFSKGGFKTDFGSKLGGMAANVGTKAALGVGGVAAKGVKQGGKMVGHKIHEKAHSAKVDRMANKVLNNPDAVTDENGNTTAKVRKWYGRTVTRTVSKDAAGHTVVSNQRSRIKALGRFSHDHTTTTDKYMTVKNKYGTDGKLLQQKVKMEAAVCRKMTNRDGSINMVAVTALRQNSTHNANDINMAIMRQILKERMPMSKLADMDAPFAAREIVQSDDNGFEMKQTNADGSTSRFRIDFNGDRAMTSVEKINTNGSAIKFSSDGIIHKRSTYNYVNGKVNADSVRNRYAFADYYTKYDSKPMDANGRLSNSIPKNKIMFEQDDLDLMADQIAHYGQPKTISEFSDK